MRNLPQASFILSQWPEPPRFFGTLTFRVPPRDQLSCLAMGTFWARHHAPLLSHRACRWLMRCERGGRGDRLHLHFLAAPCLPRTYGTAHALMIKRAWRHGMARVYVIAGARSGDLARYLSKEDSERDQYELARTAFAPLYADSRPAASCYAG